MIKLFFSALSTLVITVSNVHAALPVDPLIREAREALDGAYVSDVKPADAAYTQCTYRLLAERHIVRCGISFGGTQLAQFGYWELVRSGEKFYAYAMNGKALSALDRINRRGSLSSAAYPGVFKSGAGRTPVDFSNANAAFN